MTDTVETVVATVLVNANIDHATNPVVACLFGEVLQDAIGVVRRDSRAFGWHDHLDAEERGLSERAYLRNLLRELSNHIGVYVDASFKADNGGQDI
jgi:hypothetical protein